MRLRKLIAAPTKKEAVRQAPKAPTQEPSLSDDLRAAVKIARSLAPPDPEFDPKRFSDEMWGH